MLRRLAPYLAYWYMTLVGRTNRLRVYGNEHRERLRRADQRFIYAFWHNRQVFFTWSHRGDGLSVLVSRSRDGEIIAKVMELSGIRASRGSSSRGAGAGLRDMVEVIERGTELGITPDGPKGPVYEAKPGAVFLAQKLGIPILPSTNSSSRTLVLKRSWDRYRVPLPFGRSVIRYAPPIWVAPGDDPEAKARELKAALDRITDLADRETEGGPAGGEHSIGLSEHRRCQNIRWRALPWTARLALAALNFAAPLVAAGIVLRFAFSARRAVLRRVPGELGERWGRLPGGGAERLAGRPVLWIHAASAGEVAAASPLVAELRRQARPPAVLMTCLTGAGRDRAAQLPGVDLAVLAPIDAAGPVRRFLSAARPFALLVVETELWPHMIELSARAGVRLGLVNGRISERSFGFYRFAAGLLAPFVSRFERLAVQSEADAERFAALGARPDALRVAGNMKFDLADAASFDASGLIERLGWRGAPLFVAGSTHAGEEKAVAEAFLSARAAVPGLRLALAPRHVERAGDAAAVLEGLGLRLAKLSGTAGPGAEALILDELGALSSFYPLARASFVGGTLVAVGGHNLLEPALAGSPVIFGPHTEHQLQSAGVLERFGGGFRVSGAAELGRRVIELMGDPSAGARAREAARSLQGATRRTVEFMLPLLDPPAP